MIDGIPGTSSNKYLYTVFIRKSFLDEVKAPVIVNALASSIVSGTIVTNDQDENYELNLKRNDFLLNFTNIIDDVDSSIFFEKRRNVFYDYFFPKENMGLEAKHNRIFIDLFKEKSNRFVINIRDFKLIANIPKQDEVLDKTDRIILNNSDFATFVTMSQDTEKYQYKKNDANINLLFKLLFLGHCFKDFYYIGYIKQEKLSSSRFPAIMAYLCNLIFVNDGEKVYSLADYFPNLPRLNNILPKNIKYSDDKEEKIDDFIAVTLKVKQNIDVVKFKDILKAIFVKDFNYILNNFAVDAGDIIKNAYKAFDNADAYNIYAARCDYITPVANYVE